jgi:ATP-dependent helicase HrpB
MSGLVTVSCSRASAEQRAGRAARQGPGTVIRCYDQKAFGAAPAHQTPEIAAADLTGAALVLACWGAPGGRGLALPDAPPPAAMAEAVEVLRELGAVTPDGHATDLGKILARVPTDPRLARALLDGAATVGHRTAAEAVALVSGDQRAPGADLTRLAAVLKTGRDPGSRRWAEDVRRMEGIARQEASGVAPEESSGVGLSAPAVRVVGAAEAIGFVVALAFPDRVARRVPGGGPERYLLTSGTRAGLPAGSPLSGQEWLAVAEVSRAQGRDAAGTGAVIRSAAPLTADTAEAAARHLLSDTVEARFSQGRVSARRERRLGAIVLSSTPVRPSAEEGRAAVARALTSEGLSTIGWSTAAEGLRRRLALLHRELGGRWPDVSEPALLARLDDWLAPELEALAGGAATAGIDLAGPLSRLLPWPEASRLGELAPEQLAVPSGRHYRPPGRRRQAAGVLWLGRDAAAGRRSRAGVVPPALAGPPAAGRDRRSRLVLVRALRAGPGGNAGPLSQASLARRPVDGARDSPDQTPELTQAAGHSRRPGNGGMMKVGDAGGPPGTRTPLTWGIKRHPSPAMKSDGHARCVRLHSGPWTRKPNTAGSGGACEPGPPGHVLHLGRVRTADPQGGR